MKSPDERSLGRSTLSFNGGAAIFNVAVAAIVAAALRLAGLSDHDFWFDESCTFIYVHNLFHWPGESNLLAESTNLPYYVLLRGWVSIFGDSEAAYRSMSAAAGILTVPLLAWIAFRLHSRRAALIALVLAAVHPLHIYYSQEARAYALWVLLLSLAALLLLEACRRGTWKWWAAFGGLLWGTLHVHYWTIYWLPASVIVVAIATNRRRALRNWVLTITLLLLAFIPYFVLAVYPAAKGGGSRWIEPSFDPLTSIPRTLWAMLPAGDYPAHLRKVSLRSPDPLPPQPQWLAAGSQIIPALVFLLLLAFAFRLWVRLPSTLPSSSADGPLQPELAKVSTSTAAPTTLGLNSAFRIHPFVFAAGLTLLPLLLAWSYSVIVRPNYLVGRYDMVAWPGCILWMSLLIAEAARRTRVPMSCSAAICVALVACSLVPLHRMLTFDPPASFARTRAERLASICGPGDLVVAFSYDRDYLQYYLHRAGFTGVIRSFPTWLENQVGWVDTEKDLEGVPNLRSPVGLPEPLSHVGVQEPLGPPGGEGRVRGSSNAERSTRLDDNAMALIAQIREALAAGKKVLLLADSTDPDSSGPRSPIYWRFIDHLHRGQLTLADQTDELGITAIRSDFRQHPHRNGSSIWWHDDFAK